MIVNVDGRIWTYKDNMYYIERGRVRISISALDDENWYVSCPIIYVKSEWISKGNFPDFSRALNLIVQRLDEIKNDLSNLI